MKLKWKQQKEILETNYKILIGCISRKYYMSNKLKVLLVNAVAQATIAYRMDSILIKQKWLNELDEWTVQTLQEKSKLKATANYDIWWNVLKLNKLTQLNIARYTATLTGRILNREDTLASKITAYTNKFPSYITYRQNIPPICKHISELYDISNIHIIEEMVKAKALSTLMNTQTKKSQ